MKKIVDKIRSRLIADFGKAHRMWSVRLALFWGALNGAVIALAVFADVINPWLFLTLNMIGYGAIAIARVTKQPGIE